MVDLPTSGLAISKQGPSSVTAGANVNYTIFVRNNGPRDATVVKQDVLVNDPTPAGLVFASNTGGCTTPFPCSLGALAFGETRTITSIFTVGAGGDSTARI